MDISPRKNTDQGDFLLKRAVRAVGLWFIQGLADIGFTTFDLTLN
jgi:hypothetical protein